MKAAMRYLRSVVGGTLDTAPTDAPDPVADAVAVRARYRMVAREAEHDPLLIPVRDELRAALPDADLLIHLSAQERALRYLDRTLNDTVGDKTDNRKGPHG